MFKVDIVKKYCRQYKTCKHIVYVVNTLIMLAQKNKQWQITELDKNQDVLIACLINQDF